MYQFSLYLHSKRTTDEVAALSLTLDFSEVGVLNILQGGSTYEALHLKQDVTVGQTNGTFAATSSPFLYRDGSKTVSLRFADRFVYNIDIRDVASPTYATTQELVDDITEAIALMYA